MVSTGKTSLTLAAVLLSLLPLAACGVDVRKVDQNGKAEVDVRTPVGAVSVRTNVDAPNTGLPVYPGARALRDRDEPANANVSVGSAWFGVRVVAAKFESPDTQDRILDFYRDAMKTYGDVTECKGNVDFRGRRGARRPVCKDTGFSRDIQLVVGSEEQQRIVAVKPRGAGSEFTVVYVQAQG
jgi:hypothetical protein